MMRNKENTVQPEEQKVIGSHLQHLRQERNLTIEQVAKETKISVSNLRALEAHDYSSLPADTFTRGLLTIYGNYLDLDGAQIAARFISERNSMRKTDKAGNNKFAGHSLAPKKLAEPAHVPSATVAVALFFVIIVSFTLFCLYTSWNPFAFLNNTTKEISSTVLGVFHPTSTPVVHTVDADNLVVQVQVMQDTEMEFRIDEQVTTHREFNKGQTVEWLAEKSIKLGFPSPQSIRLTVNGNTYTLPEEYDGELVFQVKGASPQK